MTEPDTTSMTGAEFRRHAGTDVQKWAEAFIAAHDEAFVPDGDGLRSETAERVDAAAHWLRDYAEVRVAEEVGRVTAPIVAGRDRLGPGQG